MVVLACRVLFRRVVGIELLLIVLVFRVVFCQFLQVLDVELMPELETEVLIQGFIVLPKSDDVVAL